MSQPQHLYAMKNAVRDAKKIFTWTTIGRTPEGAIIGGYIETYKPQIKRILDMQKGLVGNYTPAYRFRLDAATGTLFIEGLLV